MTRIVVAPDSLKGSLSTFEAVSAIASGVRRTLPDSEVIEVPMADGGEGTVAVLSAVWGGERLVVDTLDPRGRPMAASYVRLGDGRAVVEVAAAGGLPIVADAPDAVGADSRGTGILLHHAVEHGATEVVLGLGGSASTDGGAGALTSLGARLLDAAGTVLTCGGGALPDLDRVDLDGILPTARRARWTLLCDVANPLVGPGGSAVTFGPQKGATAEDVARLDQGLHRLADALAEAGCRRVHHLPGAGAAGGIAGGLAAVFDAELLPGAEVVADVVGLDQALGAADLVITAEGRIDATSAGGKVVGVVARRAARFGVPVLALCGSTDSGFDAARAMGLAGIEVVGGGRLTLAESMRDGGTLLAETAAEAVRRA
jgi:glycerate kinase